MPPADHLALPASPVAVWWSRLLRPLAIFAALAIAAGVFLALHHLTRQISYPALLAAIHATPGPALVLSVAATLGSFIALSGYDFSALVYVGARVRARSVLLASFIAYALGNTIGLGVLTGGAVRMRLYTAAGVEPAQVARAIAFNALAFGVGIAAVSALAMLWAAPQLAGIAGLPPSVLRAIAALVLALVAALVTLCALRRSLAVAGVSIQLPNAGLVLRQLPISIVELLLSAAALWALLPASDLGFSAFAAVYMMAVVLGIASHVPGGLGVFEAVMLAALGGHVPMEKLAGALVLYRAVYYLLPLVLAVLTLVVIEVRAITVSPLLRASARLLPWLLAGMTFVVGVMLLVSGATPASESATELLALHVPLPLVEASHLLGSVIGVAYLFLARGMLQRVDAAWWAAVVLTLVGFVLALPKGIALGEMTVLLAFGVALLFSRREFNRHASLFSLRFSPGWLLGIAVTVGAVIWLLFFVYRDVEYRHELWWQFAIDGDAPRSLRAVMAMAVLSLALALWQLLRPASSEVQAPSVEELALARRIALAQPRADALMVMTGDKALMFSSSGNAFLMYGKQGRSRVAFGDPVGDAQGRRELVWRFIESAEQHGERPIFYQVPPASIPLYLDAGMTLRKLGEYASVDLAGFTLKGSARANLRHGASRGEREGLRFEWLEGERIDACLDELRGVSDAWLRAHAAREKRFSLGCFDPDYIRAAAVAVARDGQGRAVAFLNVLHTQLRGEATVDLMRYVHDAPRGTMDFLFARTLGHLSAAGFRSFGLGMAPMSGMAEHRLAPRWHRLGRLVFAHGQPLYNFQGLRTFKEKFAPDWEPRYLAAPPGVATVLALADITLLIGGGLRGVIGR